jgi:co-chaperonin GroES (HSP10)
MDDAVVTEPIAYGDTNSDAAEPGSLPVVHNTSGIIPTEYKILVLPDDVPERTAGGILVPIWARDQRQGACQTGVVVDMADEAFSFVEGCTTRSPRIGERVAYTKYAGMTIVGRDEKTYKLMNDKDVAAILDFPFNPKDYKF